MPRERSWSDWMLHDDPLSVLFRIAGILEECTTGPEGYCIIGGWVPFRLS